MHAAEEEVRYQKEGMQTSTKVTIALTAALFISAGVYAYTKSQHKIWLDKLDKWKGFYNGLTYN